MSILKRLDDFGRRHPTWMLIFVILVTALAAVPVILSNSQGAIVLYQAF